MQHWQDFGEGFWHFRGRHRVAGLVNVGTHCALVALPDGGHVFLDSYTLPGDALAEARRLTDGGRSVRAILNLHPFHTVHCRWMHQTFPEARLFGLARHREKLPDLPWDDEGCDGDALSDLYGAVLNFSVPRGVHMVCRREGVHFASVLAMHRASGTLFVDDTLNVVALPFPLSRMGLAGRVDFHPTLAGALREEAGAADAFADWARDLGAEWHTARRVAAAHNSVAELAPGSFPETIGAALGRVRPVLEKHRARYS